MIGLNTYRGPNIVFVGDSSYDVEGWLVITVPSDRIICKAAISRQVYRSMWRKRGTETVDKEIIGCYHGGSIDAAEADGKCRQRSSRPHLDAGERLSQGVGKGWRASLNAHMWEIVSEGHIGIY